MPAPPSLDTLDAELAALRSATGQLAMTLMALDADPTRRALDLASGTTAARWRPAAADLATAWTLYPQLSALVDGLIELRGSGRKPGRDAVAKLDAGLRARIDPAAAGLPPDVCARLTAAAGAPAAAGAAMGAPAGTGAPTAGGPGDPGRLGAAPLEAAGLEPAALAATLRGLLGGVTDVLAEVREVLRELTPRAEASVRALDGLRGAVDGVAESRAGQAVITTLARLADAMAADPLSVSAADFDAVDEAIAAAHAAAGSAEALRAHLAERLAAGRVLLGALPALLADAAAVRDLAASKVIDPAAGLDRPRPTAPARPPTAGRPARPPGADPLTAAQPRRLAGELTALDALAAADQWRVLAARLPAWSARVHAATDLATATRNRCRALLAQRDELRGRLGAYRAKAQAYGLAEDAELGRLADLAHGTLYTAPCDLTAAGQQVSAYIAAVGGATAARGQIAGRASGPA